LIEGLEWWLEIDSPLPALRLIEGLEWWLEIDSPLQALDRR